MSGSPGELFSAVMVANRGEIAVRIMRTLHRLGIRTVAVYSDADRDAPHVDLADVAVHIGPAPAVDSYLRIDRLIEAAQRSGAEAIHPGYGFVSENAAFARACEAAGIVFIGPPAEAIETMGDKITAKRTVSAAGVPVVPGLAEPGLGDDDLVAAADGIGFPVLIKPSAGGGGKGMRRVDAPGDLRSAIESARREAAAAFGDDTLFLERFVSRPRHIEIQVLLDAHGAGVHLGERECSLQRRHQKIVEEAPSTVLTDANREAMGAQALAAASACGYVNAGTVEFIVSADRPDEPFFMEMNTRLQVEHPVTEMVWDVDLVEHQVRVAAGEPLAFGQRDLSARGHAVEARLYAEDPFAGFVPSPGRLVALELPGGAGPLRVDAGVRAGQVVGTEYDPMIAKIVAFGDDRRTALAALDDALSAVHIAGLVTNAAFLRRLLSHADVIAGNLSTGLVEDHLALLTERSFDPDVAILAALAVERQRLGSLDPHDPWSDGGGWRVGGAEWWAWRASVDGVEVEVRRRGVGSAAEAEVEWTPAEGGDAFERTGPVPLRWIGGETSTGPSTATHDLHVVLDGRRRHARVTIDGRSIWVTLAGETSAVLEHDPAVEEHRGAAIDEGTLRSPMPGTVVAVTVAVGDEVAAGDTVVAVEAMKMEHALRSPFAGRVADVRAVVGEQVDLGALLVVIEPLNDDVAMEEHQ